MHWLTIMGIVLIGLGTFFTFIGQQKSAEESNKQILAKSEEINRLSKLPPTLSVAFIKDDNS
jgi:uncharacterized membrane protein